MLLSLAVTSPWELDGRQENNGFFHCVPVGQPGAYPMGSGHGTAWLEVLSARNLYLDAAFCASSLVHPSSSVHPLRFMLGLQSYQDTNK